MLKKGLLAVLLPLLLIQSIVQAQMINEILSDKNFRIGMVRFNNREYEAAIQLLTKSLSTQPMNFKARYYLGQAYLNAGYSKNALDEWENLLALGGGSYQVKQKLNDLYFRLSIDNSYDYSSPYIFSKLYDGIQNGMHKILRPTFILYDPQYDSLLVSSMKTGFIVEVDGNGNQLRQFGRIFGDATSLKAPTGIALYQNRLYVSDFEADTISVFERDGKFVKNLGSGQPETNKKSLLDTINVLKLFQKKPPKEHNISNLAGPMGLAISSDEYLFVVDNGNDRIQKYDLNGEWIQSIGSGDLDRPTGIVIQNNSLYVSDTYHHRIISYDTFGNLLETFGDDQLKEPRGIKILNDKLYITDAQLGLFIYDLKNKDMEKFGADEGKLEYPFDICFDSKNILYETDFNTQNIAVFNPLQLQYANIGMQVPQIWTANYPNNLVHIRIWDKIGKPVQNLKEENFQVFEEGMEIPYLRLGATTQYRNNLYAKIIIDKSLAMKDFEPELTESLNAFLQSTTGSDWIDTIAVNDQTESSGKTAANVLKPLEFINKINYASPNPVNLDAVLHDSIENLLNINRNKAIILFTAGETGNDTFPTYEPDMVMTYAKQNAIPVYIINFTDKNRDIYKRIADETFGKYYTIQDIKEILSLYKEIKNAPPLEYILSYEGLNLKGLRNYWVNLQIKIKYKDFTGVEDTGYFVPEIISEQKMFSGTSLDNKSAPKAAVGNY